MKFPAIPAAVIVTVAIVFSAACHEKKEGDGRPTQVPYASLFEPISLETAIKWRNRFQDSIQSRNPQWIIRHMGVIQGFTMPLSEFEALSKKRQDPALQTEHIPVTVRAYFGIADSGANNPVIKLIVVGVNGDNKDIIKGYNALAADAMAGDIYNFTSPCPNSCDTDSPLYHQQ